MSAKQYITQITAQDLELLEAIKKMEPGFLVRIDRSPGSGIKIGIDESALALAINGFFRNGGCNVSAADCTSVPFNPPS